MLQNNIIDATTMAKLTEAERAEINRLMQVDEFMNKLLPEEDINFSKLEFPVVLSMGTVSLLATDQWNEEDKVQIKDIVNQFLYWFLQLDGFRREQKNNNVNRIKHN